MIKRRLKQKELLDRIIRSLKTLFRSPSPLAEAVKELEQQGYRVQVNIVTAVSLTGSPGSMSRAESRLEVGQVPSLDEKCDDTDRVFLSNLRITL